MSQQMILAPQSLKEEFEKLKAVSRHHYAERDHLYDLIGMDVVELDKQHLDEIKIIRKVDKKRRDRLKSEIEKLKAENEKLKTENEEFKNGISEYEKCIPEHYDIACPHNIANIVDEFEATIDGLKTEVLTLEVENEEEIAQLKAENEKLKAKLDEVMAEEEDGYATSEWFYEKLDFYIKYQINHEDGEHSDYFHNGEETLFDVVATLEDLRDQIKQLKQK